MLAGLAGHQQQIVGLPGGLGRPSSLGLSRGQILQAVRQDTQRLLEHGDAVLEGEHATVQGGQWFMARPTGMHVHWKPPYADDADDADDVRRWHEADSLCLLLPIFQNIMTGPGW
jgi:hypothetical protein